MKACAIAFVAAFLCTIAPVAFPAASPDLAACAAITDNDRRLACYDALARDAGATAVSPGESSTQPNDREHVGHPAPPRHSTPLRDLWEIENDRDYQIAPHKPNYVLLRQGFSPNAQPFRDANEFGGSDLHFYHNELKYQLSLKSRMGADPLLGGHVWFGYTQQSLWQMWNAGISRPFRDTNYEPEVMWTFPLANEDKREQWAPRVLTFGAVHQSNGRGSTLSRSWNRLYAQFGFDNGRDMAILVRPWWRVPAHGRDDNPQIERYLGHGDVLALYRSPRIIASLLLRDNLRLGDHRGAAQVDVTFPCVSLGRLALHLQAFSGYGETLIDYNRKQTSVGIGLSASEWIDRDAGRCK